MYQRRWKTSNPFLECLLGIIQLASSRAVSKEEENSAAYVCGVPGSEHSNFMKCYFTEPLTLEERRKHVVSGQAWQSMASGIANPFQGLRKEHIIEEIESGGIWLHDEKKPIVQDKLTEILHGIARPPALCCLHPLKSTSELNIKNYEILACEPLHEFELTNVIQNLIQELPHHVGEKKQAGLPIFL